MVIGGGDAMPDRVIGPQAVQTIIWIATGRVARDQPSGECSRLYLAGCNVGLLSMWSRFLSFLFVSASLCDLCQIWLVIICQFAFFVIFIPEERMRSSWPQASGGMSNLFGAYANQ